MNSRSWLNGCPVCGGRLVRRWPAIEIFICHTCRARVRNPQPVPDELSLLYSRSWAEPETSPEETGATTRSLARQYVERLTDSLGVEALTGLRILDYGAGRGELCRALSEAGAEVHAVEPYGFQHLRARDLRVYRSLEDIPAGLRYHGITLVQVVEHLSDPRHVLDLLRSRLEPSGWIYVATPNAMGLRARLSGPRWSELQKPGHLVLYGPATLGRLLEATGYTSARRLRWRIRYGRSVLLALVHRVLQWTLLDGDLRFLALAPSP